MARANAGERVKERSTFRVLWPFSRLVAAVLFTLDRSRIARDKSCFFQWQAIFLIRQDKRTRDAVTNGTSLT